MDTEVPELEHNHNVELEIEHDVNLQDEKELITSPAEEEKEEGIEVPSEEKDLSLKERVKVLEKTVVSMADALTRLEDAFNSLQNKASISAFWCFFE